MATSRLLLSCATTTIDDNGIDRIGSLAGERVGWDALIAAADRHGVAPLVYRSLRAACRDAVPVAIMDQLRRRAQGHAVRGHHLTGELLAQLQHLEAHGIEAVPFKGPVLAARAYGDAALRPFADLDIAVRARDMPKAVELLAARGYEPASRRPPREAAPAYYGLVHRARMVRLDLQRALADPGFSFALDDDRLWGHQDRVALGSTMVRGFAPEGTLVIVCAHGAKHAWQRLVWVCDVAELVRACPGMDWERVLEQARALGALRMMLLGLCLARTLLGTSLPPAIDEAIASDRTTGALVSSIASAFSGDGPRRDVEKSVFLLAVRERLRDRVPHYPHLALRNSRHGLRELDRALLQAPRSLSFVYPLLGTVRAAGVWLGVTAAARLRRPPR